MTDDTAVQMGLPAKVSLYFLVFGFVLLLGGIVHQIAIGVSMMGAADVSAEKMGYLLMSRGSLELIAAYAIVFVSGIAFWLLGPYKFKRDRWFLAAFLCFYAWVPVDVYTMSLDLSFATQFDPDGLLTEPLKALFLSRQESLGPIPLLILASYLIGIGLVLFKPRLGQRPTIA